MVLLAALDYNHFATGNQNMGICLDTEQSNDSQMFDDGRETWARNSPRDARALKTPPDGQFPMHNAGTVNFETPKVPVIFVLGGPGSGKVTHCDNLMQEKKGITHINMTDLLQQYAIGNDLQDFSLLSSRTVTEVLMLEMKMAPNAKTYLVSGYPRNMRDVVEYSEKIQVVNGVILISWRQKVLERQIDYGAKLGQVVLSLARMELTNFYKHVMPVADYFDQSNMLISINGERHPGDVYRDFRASVMKILGMQDNPPSFTNGRVATVPADVTTELPTRQSLPTMPSFGMRSERLVEPPTAEVGPESQRPQTQIISVSSNQPVQNYQSPVKQGWPPILWVIGGPGSNKALLCAQASKDTGWAHISLGKILRAAAETATKHGGDAATIRESITNGDMVPLTIIMKVVESHMNAKLAAPGILLDGFPRDMTQATEFEMKFKQKPTIVLLDCSKLQLGRGRLDDSVTAFRRRLEIFRQHSLPMLKTMDNIGRLTIVDGDTDTALVQEDFKNVIKEHIQYINETTGSGSGPPTHSNVLANGNAVTNGSSLIPNGHARYDSMVVEDLEAEPIETISKRVGSDQTYSIANGLSQISNGLSHLGNGTNHMANGHGPARAPSIGKVNHSSFDLQRQDNIRNMYGGINMEGHM